MFFCEWACPLYMYEWNFALTPNNKFVSWSHCSMQCVITYTLDIHPYRYVIFLNKDVICCNHIWFMPSFSVVLCHLKYLTPMKPARKIPRSQNIHLFTNSSAILIVTVDWQLGHIIATRLSKTWLIKSILNRSQPSFQPWGI